MSDIAFIETLSLARDARLAAFHPALEGAGVRRDLETRRSAVEVAADLVGDETRAAVNGGSIVSFVAGVSQPEKADVLFTTQLAQRAASAKHDRFADTEAWYGLYSEVMERVGWVGESLAFTRHTSMSGRLEMDKSAIDVIAEIATGNQLAILIRALDTVKGLADNDGAIKVFELQAAAELSGNYQLSAVQRDDNGALAMALGAFRFTTTENGGRFLFWTWGAEEIEFWAAAQKMTLNRDHYKPLRDTVVQKLADDAKDYLVDLPVT